MTKYNLYHKNITNYEYTDNKIIKTLECDNLDQAIEQVRYNLNYISMRINCDHNTAIFTIDDFKLFNMDIVNMIILEQDDL